jgi:hypothetical protein
MVNTKSSKNVFVAVVLELVKFALPFGKSKLLPASENKMVEADANVPALPGVDRVIVAACVLNPEEASTPTRMSFVTFNFISKPQIKSWPWLRRSKPKKSFTSAKKNDSVPIELFVSGRHLSTTKANLPCEHYSQCSAPAHADPPNGLFNVSGRHIAYPSICGH